MNNKEFSFKFFFSSHSKRKVGEKPTFVGKNRYNDKKVGILTTLNGSHTHKSD
jgi:hypothetical protein